MKVYVLQQCDVEGCHIIDVFGTKEGAQKVKDKLLSKELNDINRELERCKKEKDQWWIDEYEDILKNFKEDGELIDGSHYVISAYKVKGVSQ